MSQRAASAIAPRRSWPFRGWAVVAGVFCLLAIASGLGFYNASVYLEAVVSERGISVTVASGASAAFFVTFGLAGLPISRWLLTHDPRSVILAGGAVGGAGLLGLGAATTTWQLYLAFITFGLGFAAISFVPGTTLVTRWFVRRRALALVVATSGLSVGGIVLTPATAQAIERAGLSAVTPTLALVWLVGVTVVTLLAIRPSPEALGLEPDGDPRPAQAPPSAGGLTAAAAYRTRTFWALSAGLTVLLMTQIAVLAHLYPLVLLRTDPGAASLAVSLVAGASIAGRFVGAWVLLRLDALRFAVGLAALQMIAVAGLAADLGWVGIVVATLAFGATVGNLIVLLPLVIVDTFGPVEYPRIYAMIQLVSTLGIASGPLLLGAARDATGSYATGTWIAAALTLAAAAVLLATVRTRRAEDLLGVT